jgi:hypothetical protein
VPVRLHPVPRVVEETDAAFVQPFAEVRDSAMYPDVVGVHALDDFEALRAQRFRHSAGVFRGIVQRRVSVRRVANDKRHAMLARGDTLRRRACDADRCAE